MDGWISEVCDFDTGNCCPFPSFFLSNIQCYKEKKFITKGPDHNSLCINSSVKNKRNKTEKIKSTEEISDNSWSEPT